MSRIALDIDDTLYPFCNAARDKIAEIGAKTGNDLLITAAYTPWPEWRSPTDVMGLDIWLEIIDHVHQDETILKQEPYDGAVDVVNRLYDAGYDLTYISNRDLKTHEATQSWLQACGFPLDKENTELICTTGDKTQHMRDCQYIIDDRPKTLIQFVYDFHWAHKHGSDSKRRLGFGLHKEYNRSLTDAPGIYLAPSWNLLELYLAKKGLLGAPTKEPAHQGSS
jgi:hypothetical protein